MAKRPKIPSKWLALIKRVKAKRPRTVIDHILKHGHVTTQELRDLYGYNHPPRAARDVREQGIPLETISVTGKDGRKIGAYRFGDLNKMDRRKLGGRTAFPKAIRTALLERSAGACEICCGKFDETYLQIDHRVPYEVAGELRPDEIEGDDLLLICASCQRRKSWSCEHCKNWLGPKKEATCRVCFWSRPENYAHIASADARRIEISWVGPEVRQYEALVQKAARKGLSLNQYVKLLFEQDVRGS
ncbi:MAG: HNH endonuclease [Thermodesulfobacteriota bacterium]